MRRLLLLLLAHAASAAPAAATETKGQGRSLITLHQVHAWLHKHGWGPTMKPVPDCVEHGNACATGTEKPCCNPIDQCIEDDISTSSTTSRNPHWLTDMPGGTGHCKAPDPNPDCAQSGDPCTTGTEKPCCNPIDQCIEDDDMPGGPGHCKAPDYVLGGAFDHYSKSAIYVIVTPSTKWLLNSEVQKALTAEKQWLPVQPPRKVLHMTITGFETNEVNRMGSVDETVEVADEMHRIDTLRKVVDEGAASTALNDHKWHPHADSVGIGKDSSGANRITIKSKWLTSVASNARGKGLTDVKSPDSEGRWHMTIGGADPNILRAMVLDSSTKFSLGLAVAEEKDGHLQVQYATHERCLSGEPALPKLGPCAKALT